VQLLTQKVVEDSDFSHINEVKLHSIVISESSKAYLTKQVDLDNHDGAYAAYKAIVAEVGGIVSELSPTFNCPNMLVSTVIVGSHHQRFYAEHLPKLTNVMPGEDLVPTFYKDLVFKAIQVS